MSSSSFNAVLTLSPALVGTTLASCLFSCSIIQTFGYYRQFPSDSTIIKPLQVATIMLLTLVHIVCVIYWTWMVTVAAFGKPNKVMIFTSSRGANLVITTFICYLVQLFFAFHLYRFSESWLLPTICSILGGISFVGTLINTARALSRQSLGGNMNAQYWLTILTLCAKTKISRTINLLDRLTVWSIARNWACDKFSLQQTTYGRVSTSAALSIPFMPSLIQHKLCDLSPTYRV
ncbi:hypothetical protein F5J12DRAFT_786083 [Pisolithus orientalis]|uniref:uncharacterized protein n=1 Tax=Pisolithus orientalis TaxID=936130 RepID=UPI002225258F|nr:uncharacterized protein F5J12DRAFT_786083 [Pisolithus orientalis]KAI5993098.1 hypothetical protein F5J12DRAFT_786083 [Pisolithus orientalis]